MTIFWATIEDEDQYDLFNAREKEHRLRYIFVPPPPPP